MRNHLPPRRRRRRLGSRSQCGFVGVANCCVKVHACHKMPLIMLAINFYCLDADANVDTDLDLHPRPEPKASSLLPQKKLVVVVVAGQGNLWHTCGMAIAIFIASHSPGHIWRHIARFYRSVYKFILRLHTLLKNGHIQLAKSLVSFISLQHLFL